MDNGIYIMLSRQTGLFRQMDATANNIANANTNGYQAEKLTFTDYLVNDKSTRRDMAFTRDRASYLDTREGPLEVTGGTLDVAISGDGYFVVQTPAGQRYTRAGNFQIDQEGFLTNAQGYFVLDEANQPIQFEPEAQDITIGEAGNISVDGEDFGALGVVEFPNRQALEHESGSLFRAQGQPLPGDNSRVMQGVLEKSNVQSVTELVEMTEISRSVGSTAKYIEMMYDLQRKANSTYAQTSNV